MWDKNTYLLKQLYHSNISSLSSFIEFHDSQDCDAVTGALPSMFTTSEKPYNIYRDVCQKCRYHFSNKPSVGWHSLLWNWRWQWVCDTFKWIITSKATFTQSQCHFALREEQFSVFTMTYRPQATYQDGFMLSVCCCFLNDSLKVADIIYRESPEARIAPVHVGYSQRRLAR